MKTRIYDINQNKFTSQIFEGGYYVDGVKREVEPPLYELQLIEQIVHNYNPNTERIQKIEPIIDLNLKTYTFGNKIVQLTEYEILIKEWRYTNFAKRIVAPKELVMEDIGIKMLGWFQVNGFPIKPSGNNVQLYCNVILPQHQGIVDNYAGLIIVEDRPYDTTIP